MQFTHEIEQMCCVKKGCNHGPAPIPQEGNWTQSKEITDISGLTPGVGWCAPQQGTCKLTLNVKNGIVEEALVETSGCSGMTHSAATAAEILPGKTVLEAVSYTHLDVYKRQASFPSFMDSSLTFYLVLGALLVGFIVLGMLKGMIKMLLFLSLIHI